MQRDVGIEVHLCMETLIFFFFKITVVFRADGKRGVDGIFKIYFPC